MTIYSFFPYSDGGDRLGSIKTACADDTEALGCALRILASHASATEVLACQGERFVGRIDLAQAASASAASGAERACFVVVEDDFFQAQDLQTLLTASPDIAVRCIGHEQEAVTYIENTAVDAAIVDVDLGGGPSFKVAEALERRGVPFVFFTAHDEGVIPSRWRHVERYLKPADPVEVARRSRRLLGPERAPCAGLHHEARPH